MHITTMFSQFIREKQFIGGVSPRTVKAFIDERGLQKTNPTFHEDLPVIEQEVPPMEAYPADVDSIPF